MGFCCASTSFRVRTSLELSRKSLGYHLMRVFLRSNMELIGLSEMTRCSRFRNFHRQYFNASKSTMRFRERSRFFNDGKVEASVVMSRTVARLLSLTVMLCTDSSFFAGVSHTSSQIFMRTGKNLVSVAGVANTPSCCRSGSCFKAERFSSLS